MARPTKALTLTVLKFADKYMAKFKIGPLEELTPEQRKRMLNCYRVSSKREHDLSKGIKRHTTATLSVEAHRLLSQMARQKNMTMSEVILDILK
jgi:hypothetical protein